VLVFFEHEPRTRQTSTIRFGAKSRAFTDPVAAAFVSVIRQTI
jgi:hypothetical protein